jgi:hypothetical protein
MRQVVNLIIGMERDATSRRSPIAAGREDTDHEDQMVIDYGDDKAVSLQFQTGCIIRFELFAFLPDAKRAFDEEQHFAAIARRAEETEVKSVLLYDAMLPNDGRCERRSENREREEGSRNPGRALLRPALALVPLTPSAANNAHRGVVHAAACSAYFAASVDSAALGFTIRAGAGPSNPSAALPRRLSRRACGALFRNASVDFSLRSSSYDPR